MTKTCPICKKPSAAEFEPFCSKRCSDVDLGNWLGERYAIPGTEAAKKVPVGDDD
ncbi:MAG: DNA gyrase inhibitor YacG [Sphingomonadales bacterium]